MAKTTVPEDFISSVVPLFKKALNVDRSICKLYQCIHKYIPFDYELAKFGVCSVLVGSMSEGAVSPRWYLQPKMLESDVLYLTKTGQVQSPHDLGTPVPGRIGIYQGPQKRSDFVSMVDQRVCNDGYGEFADFPKYHGTEMASGNARSKSPTPNHETNKFLHYYNASFQIQGPAANYTFQLAKEGNLQHSADMVCAFQIDGWPPEAAEWKTRERKWPPPHLVKEALQKGYQIVKRPGSSKGEDGSLEISITFTLVENLLAKNRSQVQQLVYLMAKTIFYDHLNIKDETNPRIGFPSYAMKTTMMWLMEEIPADRWTEENIWFLLKELFRRLQLNVENGYVESYFMRGANILYTCPSAILSKANKKLLELDTDIMAHLNSTKLVEGLSSYSPRDFQVLFSYHEDQLVDNLVKCIQNTDVVCGTMKHMVQLMSQDNVDEFTIKGQTLNVVKKLDEIKELMKLFSKMFVEHLIRGTDQDGGKEVDSGPAFADCQTWEEISHILSQNPREVSVIRYIFQEGVERPTAKFKSNVKSFNPEPLVQKHCSELHELHQHGEQDLLIVRRGKNSKVYKFASIEGLFEYYSKATSDGFAKGMRDIYMTLNEGD